VVLSNGRTTMPSMVAFDPKTGQVLRGDAAKSQAPSNPTNTFFSIKRILGLDPSDSRVRTHEKAVPYSLTEDPDGSLMLRCEAIDNGTLYPEEVSAEVLDALLGEVEQTYGARPTKAVIAVPAYFSEDQRDATVQAGMLAGLEVVRLIHEPVAAALAYGFNLQEDKTVLVFDLGGGTYDISILEVGGGVVEVLATGGEAYLGGDDWDRALSDWLAMNYLKPAGVPSHLSSVRANLRGVAEQAKIELSTQEKVVVRMPGGSGGRSIEVTLTRQLLEEISADLFRKARQAIDIACWQAGVDLGSSHLEAEVKKGKQVPKVDKGLSTVPRAKYGNERRQPISEVLLVGGATRMAAIKTFVKNMTGIDPKEGSINPDEAVALGAAIQAGIYQGTVKDLMVLDPWKASLMRAFAKREIDQNPDLMFEEEEEENDDDLPAS